MPRVRNRSHQVRVGTDFTGRENSRALHVSGAGHVYFVRVEGLIKIGWTQNWGQRKAAYPDGVLLIKIRGTRRDEAALHEKFSTFLARGNEWFRPELEIIRFIDSLAEKGFSE